jgi:hypothetical protein
MHYFVLTLANDVSLVCSKLLTDYNYFQECPVGTYKNVVGSNSSLCTPCSLDGLPNRADFTYVRGRSLDLPCLSAIYVQSSPLCMEETEH